MALPEPTPEARAHSDRVAEHIRGDIAASGGWISFAALHGARAVRARARLLQRRGEEARKGGRFRHRAGNLPLYGQTLARQVHEILQSGFDEVLEVGAGSGALAATLLEELERCGTDRRATI